jgi:hypothetical protein
MWNPLNYFSSSESTNVDDGQQSTVIRVCFLKSRSKFCTHLITAFIQSESTIETQVDEIEVYLISLSSFGHSHVFLILYRVKSLVWQWKNSKKSKPIDQ